jgi:hypothetical protein
MAKTSRIQSKKTARRAANVIDTAELAKVSPRTVQRVVKGDQENEKVLTIYMILEEKREAAMKEIEKEMINWNSIFNRNPMGLPSPA